MTTKVTASTLANTAVTIGTYGGASQIPVVIVDKQGRLTSAANATPSIATTQLTGTISSSQLAAGAANTNIGFIPLGPTLTSSLVTTALGFTPYNATNPSGYQTTSGSVASATSATTATNATNILGSSQTWTNVTGSRSYNTTYTNSTGKPIQVWMNSDQPRGGAVTNGYVNGNLACRTVMDLYPRAFCTFVVPIGGTYYIDGGSNLDYWLELR
jgi:hypothetical protein